MQRGLLWPRATTINLSMTQDMQLFTSTVTAVFLEAAPFLLLGALISSVFEVYLPQDRLEKLMPKGRLLGLLFGLGAGMFIPTCECGVVPIVRRLLKKGVPPQVALTYMLSAPVINPLTILATYIAFRGNMWMVLGRIGLVAACASCIGLALARINPALLLRDGASSPDLIIHGHEECCPVDGVHVHHIHDVQDVHHVGHDLAHGCGCGCAAPQESRLIQVLLHTASEFLDMGKFLILGALAVGLFKILLFQDALEPFQNSLFLAVGVMMLLAFFLSICAQADAFVAASFSAFPGVAQLSFVTLGPMVDLKLVAMYGAVFRTRIALTLILVPVALIYLVSFLAGMVIR